jgi:hypothetical protein
MTGIQTMMDDVVFYYKKKTGFPRVSDSGVVSVHVSFSTLSFDPFISLLDICRLVVQV